MPGTKVDKPPLNTPIVDREGRPTKAMREFLRQGWERSGGFEDFIASLQGLLGDYQALSNQVESLEADLSNVQTLLAEAVGALVYSETADLSERLEALQAELGQLQDFTSGFDQDEIRYANVADKPKSIDALDDLAPQADRVPYFDGAASAALATFTSTARGLVAKASKAAMRVFLEIDRVYTDTYDSTGGTDVTSGAVVQLDTERTTSASDFSLSSGEITYNASSRLFLLNAQVATDTGGGRDNSVFYVEKSTDGGSTWSEIPGTRGYMYNRTSANGESQGATSALLTLNAGDKLRLWAVGLSASGPVTTIADACGMTILRA